MSRRLPFAALLLPVALAASGVAHAAVALTTSIKFAAYGDIDNSPGSRAVAKLARRQNAQFILMLGDLCYGTQPIAVQVNANYSRQKAAGKLWPALGNHEFTDPCGGGNLVSAYRAYFNLPNNERYYSFTIGPVHFFVLNSYKDPDGTSATSTQATWLKEKLAAS